MFEYFQDNYGWSLAVAMALGMGGEISEIDEICRPLRPLACNAEQHADEWFTAWSRLAHRLTDLAATDERRGHSSSAGRKLLRSALYFQVAERQVMRKTEATSVAYADSIDLFMRGARLSGHAVERVEVPFGNTSMPALYLPASGGSGPLPAMVHFGGLDVTKELIYLWHVHELPRFGVAVLICDHPGLGESLRFRGLNATHEIEHAASACYSYLAGRPEIDPRRLGIMALSLGGYYAPRAAAFEPRFACCVLWGAIWSVPELFAWLNDQPNPAMSVPLEEQFRWVLGANGIDQTRELLSRWELADVMGRIRCPILTVHGGNDRQAPLFLAEKTHQAAVNSARRELKVLTLDEGGAEHCQADNVTMGTDYMFHWIADVLAARPVAPARAGVGP